MNPVITKQTIERFLIEDLGFGDPSTQMFATQKIKGQFVAKQTGLLCGQTIPQQVYDCLGAATYTPSLAEGSPVLPGTVIGTVVGDAGVLLAGERTILNLMQHMSGIATTTQTAVQTLADPEIKIADTRKTTPGLRIFDKYAVTVGGGYNHRLGLDHGIMLKDNHIAAAGSLTAAVTKARQYAGPMMQIEVEVETKAQVLEAVAAKADIIMLDNQKPEIIKTWCRLIPPSIITEASGGITLANLATYRHCAATFISLGFLTNAVQPLDLSFYLEGVIKA